MAYRSSVGCDLGGDQPTGYAIPSACFHTPEITITQEILVFIEELLGRDDLDSEIQNAVVISFVELEKFKELQIRVPPRIECILTKYQGGDNAI
jgi:hypothetical protein